MANIAQSVNVISPLMTTKSGLMKQTTWYPLLLYSKYMRGSSIAAGLRCGEYLGDTSPAWIRGAIETPWLDVSAALGDDGVVSLAVVNIHEEKAFTARLKGLEKGVEVEAFKVTGKNVKVTNTEEKEEVGVETEKVTLESPEWTFEKHSLTILRWKA